MGQLQSVAVLRSLFQDVPLRANVADERHHHLFANRINRRVGYLSEELLEIIEQRLWPVTQAGQRRVCSHRADRLLTFGSHRLDDHLQIFIGITERPLPRKDGRVVGGMDAHRLRQLIERDLIFF